MKDSSPGCLFTRRGIPSSLSLPAVSWARKIELLEEGVRLERMVPDGCEVLCGPLPALVTVSHEAGELRRPTLAAIRKAKQKPLHTLTPGELELGPELSPAIELISLELPRRERNCRIIQGETPAEAGKNLVHALIQDRVLTP